MCEREWIVRVVIVCQVSANWLPALKWNEVVFGVSHMKALEVIRPLRPAGSSARWRFIGIGIGGQSTKRSG